MYISDMHIFPYLLTLVEPSLYHKMISILFTFHVLLLLSVVSMLTNNLTHLTIK